MVCKLSANAESSQTFFSDYKKITWYDLKCIGHIYEYVCPAPLFGCLGIFHRSHSPLCSLFKRQKHLKNKSRK